MSEQNRAGVFVRSGDTHVIDPTDENAEAVNIVMHTAPADGVVKTPIEAEPGSGTATLSNHAPRHPRRAKAE